MVFQSHRIYTQDCETVVTSHLLYLLLSSLAKENAGFSLHCQHAILSSLLGNIRCCR
jgi:hypothetical protein